MEFVLDFSRNEQVVKRLRAAIKAKLVLCSAIEVDLQACGRRIVANDRERAIAVPEGTIEGHAERRTHSALNGLLAGSPQIRARQLSDQRSTVRADRSKHLWIAEREPQRGITSH